ncbi:MAG TPA: hypothetical protein VEC99_02730 [Clostridia bacterium]|nr:hypothetical protein [Clostridia bacterium]
MTRKLTPINEPARLPAKGMRPFLFLLQVREALAQSNFKPPLPEDLNLAEVCGWRVGEQSWGAMAQEQPVEPVLQPRVS